MQRAGEIFRVLADPTRRELFERLSRGEAPVKELTAKLDVSQPAVSQHLAVLREAGLVTERKDGRHVVYRVSPSGLKPLVRWLEQHQELWLDRLERLKKVLEEMDE